MTIECPFCGPRTTDYVRIEVEKMKYPDKNGIIQESNACVGAYTVCSICMARGPYAVARTEEEAAAKALSLYKKETTEEWWFK